MILDAGVLVSIDRGEGVAGTLLRLIEQRDDVIHTTEPVVGQVWRVGARQARLARVLRSAQVHPLDDGRRVGRLLGTAGTSDVVDAHLVVVAVELREQIVTGDPDDLRRLAAAFGDRAPAIHAWP